MKAHTIISALLIMLALTSQAASPQRFLEMYDVKGRILLMPVNDEEAVETLPFDLHKEFLNAFRLDANRPIDISKMTRPEEEVDDIPSNLKILFPQLSVK